MKHPLFRVCALLLVLTLAALPACAERFVYGQSELGRDLECERVGGGSVTVLLVFAVHGFEDAYARDGQMLVNLAEDVIAHYSGPGTLPEGIRLLVVPCANPDGLLEGKSKNGFGRCNANGLDINRDFDAGWKKLTSARSRTGSEPFATAEARALRDLTLSEGVDYGADIHGWIHCVYGDETLAAPFMAAFGAKHRTDKSGGKLSQWLDANTRGAVLVELPEKPKRKGYREDTAGKLIEGLDGMFALILNDTDR